MYASVGDTMKMEAHVSHVDDGSTLIEWIADDCRFGVSIEPDLKESSWYYVTKHGPDGHIDSVNGDLPAELLAIIEKAHKWDKEQRSLHADMSWVDQYYQDDEPEVTP